MLVGILGGGQLARMLILAGKPLGLDFIVYTPSITSTTRDLAQHIEAPMDDFSALDAFADQVDVITYETESIALETVRHVESLKPLRPSSIAIEKAQDRLYEKELFTQLSIPTNRFIPVDSSQDITKAADELGLPFIIKSRRGGYDGKNQWRIKTEGDLKAILATDLSDAIAEEFVAFEREVSVIAVRSENGDVVPYDICENQHHEGILHSTTVRLDDPVYSEAKSYIQSLLEHLNYVGVLAVEFFVKDNGLIANEMAPRVHNSGHWTIEGANTSQFENHLRAICQLPLGQVTTMSQVKMLNIIGQFPDREQVLATPYTKLHDYQKSPRPGRKLGHVTVSAASSADLESSAAKIESYV